MKKLAITLGIFALSFAAQAQQVSFGGRVSAISSHWKAPINAPIKAKIGVEVAVAAPIKISDRFSILPEFGYSQMGLRAKQDDTRMAYKQSYLILPILARYTTTEGLSVFAGPQLGFMLSAEMDIEGEKADVSEQIKSSDIFLVVGTDYAFKSGWGITLRYNSGLTNIYSGGQDGNSDDLSINNRSWTLGVTYTLKKKK